MWANMVVYIAVELEHDPVENSIQEDKILWQTKESIIIIGQGWPKTLYSSGYPEQYFYAG